jgi:hypothetical protein
MAYEADQPSGNMPDDYDRVLSRVMAQNEVTQTRPAVYRQVPLFGIGGTSVYSVQTFRQAGDILDVNEAGGQDRIVTGQSGPNPAGHVPA